MQAFDLDRRPAYRVSDETPRLRRASTDDVPTIVAIYNGCMRRGEICRHGRELSVDELAAILPASGDRSQTFVATVRGEVQGFAAFLPWHARAAYAATLELMVYVAEPHRGFGLAKALITQIVAAATTGGYRSVIALSRADDAVAARLSTSLGFAVAGALSEVCPGSDRLHAVTLYQRMLGTGEVT